MQGVLQYEGTFEEGTYSGDGIFYDTATGAIVYKGGFEKGERSGEGILYNP